MTGALSPRSYYLLTPSLPALSRRDSILTKSDIYLQRMVLIQIMRKKQLNIKTSFVLFITAPQNAVITT